MDQMLKEQLKLETCAVDEGITAYRKQLSEGGMMPPHVHLLKLGMDPLSKAVLEFQKSHVAGVNGKFQQLIKDVPPEELAYLTLWYTFTHTEKFCSLQSLSVNLGREIRDHLEYRRFREANPALCIAVQHQCRSKHKRHLRTVLMLAKRSSGVEDLAWNKATQLGVGSALLHLLVQSTGMFDRTVTEINVHGNETPAVLVAKPEVQRWLKQAHEHCEVMNPRYHVCVIPPKDWVDVTGGGFHSGVGAMNLPVIKTHSSDHLEKVKEHSLDRLYTLLNRLQQVPWRVNQRVLSVLNEVWKIDGRLGVLARGLNTELPVKHWSTREEWVKWKEEHPVEAKRWKREARDAYAKRAKAEGQLVNLSNITGRARMYASYPRFYFCWQMDYRGRIYPVQLHLNPQGCDLSKGLLEFADGKPLGPRGGHWLKIHLANSYANGIDKKPIAERIAWVEQYREAILDSGRFPLDGLRMWTEAEDPWQFLSAAVEYAGWADSGYSDDFVSHIPVGVDGSCNGLQHLSALMRDRVGGQHVNMLPCDVPQDIYARVAERVAAAVERDLGREEEWKDKGVTVGELAQKWHGKVSRKIVKRNVMTLPYGVTAIGMRNQLEEELYKSGTPGMEELAGFSETAYLVEKVYGAIGEIIESADTCMKWIRKFAQVFNKAGKCLNWITPVGLYVEQRYWKTKEVRVRPYWGTQRIDFRMQADSQKIDPIKQVGGSSPNVIHSFDAAHLCMTVERCWDHGLRYFAMVHDSYATHAADIDTLSVDLRAAFVELYSRDRLEELREYWLAQLPEEYHNDCPLCPDRDPVGISEWHLEDTHYFFV